MSAAREPIHSAQLTVLMRFVVRALSRLGGGGGEHFGFTLAESPQFRRKEGRWGSEESDSGQPRCSLVRGRPGPNPKPSTT